MDQLIYYNLSYSTTKFAFYVMTDDEKSQRSYNIKEKHPISYRKYFIAGVLWSSIKASSTEAMEKTSRERELESQVVAQQKQLLRYETRLKGSRIKLHPS